MFPCKVLVNIYFPNNLLTCTLSMRIYFIVIGTFPQDLLLLNKIKFVLFNLNDNLLILSQSLALFNSLLSSEHCSFKSY